MYELGLKTLEAGDTEEAEMICRRALATCEQDPNLLCLLAEIHEEWQARRYYDMTEFNEWQEQRKTETEKTMKVINK